MFLKQLSQHTQYFTLFPSLQVGESIIMRIIGNAESYLRITSIEVNQPICMIFRITPPPTKISVAVINLAASFIKNLTTPETSSGVSFLFKGVAFFINPICSGCSWAAFSPISVSMTPGEKVTTCAPFHF